MISPWDSRSRARVGVHDNRSEQAGPARPGADAPALLFDEESAVAKGQKKSNREVRKPKADKPKPVAAAPSYLTPPSLKK